MVAVDRSGVTRGADGVLRYDRAPQTVVEAVSASVDRSPSDEAVVELDGERLGYAALWERAHRTAAGLRTEGVKPGDRVLIVLPNSCRWVIAYLGTQLCGAVPVPVNPHLPTSRIVAIAGDAEPAWTVMESDALPEDGRLVRHATDGHELADVLYTSGTTGQPKGVMATHANLGHAGETTRRVMSLPSLGEALRSLLTIPLHHSAGAHSVLLPTLALGGTCVIIGDFHRDMALAAIAKERITFVLAVPAVFTLLLDRAAERGADLSSLETVVYGAAPVEPTLVSRLRDAVPAARLGNAFGMTEIPNLATYLPDEYAESHVRSIGFPTPVTDARVDSPDADGVGELLLRAPNVSPGYWRNPEATAATFVDAWLRTGDLARIDDEGFVYLIDRRDDVINRGGEKVYAREVESVLLTHESVVEAAAFAMPDRILGQTVAAVVVTDPSTHLHVEDLQKYAARSLPAFKVPDRIAIWHEPLPRNAAQKIIKSEIRDRLDQRPSHERV